MTEKYVTWLQMDVDTQNPRVSIESSTQTPGLTIMQTLVVNTKFDAT